MSPTITDFQPKIPDEFAPWGPHSPFSPWGGSAAVWCDEKKLAWIITTTTRELDLLKEVPEEVQVAHFEKTVLQLASGTTLEAVLTPEEASKLVEAAKGSRFPLPSAISSDGTPSLCGIIGSGLGSRGVEKSMRDVGMAAGAAIGAAAGASFGGLGGAIAGAALGALCAGAMLQ
ncbi:hypothetical protein ABZ499_31805 [Streptomyces sp. NPDC019990]|uniref:hypothetical protein n=1 Tax=Streptomyces sp. NPDC019990 TaxID=3154693 RepID=UPI0033EDAA3E